MKILVAGDYRLNGRVKADVDNKNYRAFEDVIPITAEVNYSIVNLESPVIDNEAVAIAKTGPNLKCSSNALEAIKIAGFDCVTLANNHFYDYGDQGVEETINACKKFGLEYVGGGINLKDAQRILYKQIDNKVIAIINLCENEWSIATNNSGGSNPLNTIQNYYQIQEARKIADYVLVIVHGGKEHYQLPTPRMKETYHYFIDCGADVVINHHQHCYSGYEIYNNKPIFYGLGNFCFDDGALSSRLWTEGYMIKLDIDNDDFDLLPYTQCKESPIIKLLNERTEFDHQIEIINHIINNDDLLKLEYNKKIIEETKSYYSYLEPIYTNKYLNYLYRKGILPSIWSRNKIKCLLNILRCETHYEILVNIIKNKI